MMFRVRFDKQKPFKDELLQARQAVTLPPVKKYSNHECDYVQASMEDEAFQHALEDGYEVVSGNGSGYSVLRKKKDQAHSA